MKASDFLELAKALAVSGGEAERRSAISRAYYAAFHEVREFFEQTCRIEMSRGAAAHGDVLKIFSNMQTTETKRAEIRLESLKKDRNRADYELAHLNVVTPDNVRARLHDAERVFNLIAQLRQIADPAVIENARQYASKVLQRPLK